MRIAELPICERPREKMLRLGRQDLSTGELLAILIRTGTNDKSAKSLAEEIISMSEEGIIFLRDCSIEELLEIRGIGLAKASQVMAAVELGVRIATQSQGEKLKIRESKDVVHLFMERMRSYRKEVFNALLLDAKGGIIGIENVSVGDVTSSIVHPRETFSKAIRRGAFALILVHNHPSGDATPSREDVNVTKRLMGAGDILGIKVLDHIVLGDGNYVSMKSEGLI